MRYLGVVVTFLILIIIPNLVWLATSSVRIHNFSNQPISAVAYSACETTHAIGNLAPGQSTFRFLEACGDDTLEILIGSSRFCRTYVEGELYHIDVTIKAHNDVGCSYDHLFSSLLIKKALW